ncbi:MAG: hypothetical protein IJO69_01225 [Ruminiclostridium sp.]|nr:hypothetical protein [Ruminiclostridium sp.]
MKRQRYLPVFIRRLAVNGRKTAVIPSADRKTAQCCVRAVFPSPGHTRPAFQCQSNLFSHRHGFCLGIKKANVIRPVRGIAKNSTYKMGTILNLLIFYGITRDSGIVDKGQKAIGIAPKLAHHAGAVDQKFAVAVLVVGSCVGIVNGQLAVSILVGHSNRPVTHGLAVLVFRQHALVTDGHIHGNALRARRHRADRQQPNGHHKCHQKRQYSLFHVHSSF